MAHNRFLKSLNVERVFYVVVFLFLVALLVSGVVAAIYFFWFSAPLSTTHEVWGQFGDFIGGTLNPIIGLFALTALLLTIVLQSKELEATREQLERSARAQEQSEAALAKQAMSMEQTTRLAALNALLAYTDYWIEEYQANKIRMDSPRYSQYKYWVEERRPKLIDHLDEIFRQMYKDKPA